MLKALGGLLLYCCLFLFLCAIAVYPVLQFVEWLPLCPGNPQGMSERECGYGVIWMVPLLTVVLGAAGTALIRRGLLAGARERKAEEAKKMKVSQGE